MVSLDPSASLASNQQENDGQRDDHQKEPDDGCFHYVLLFPVGVLPEHSVSCLTASSGRMSFVDAKRPALVSQNPLLVDP